MAELDQLGAGAPDQEDPGEGRASASARHDADPLVVTGDHELDEPRDDVESDGELDAAPLDDLETDDRDEGEDEDDGVAPAKVSRWDRPPPPKDWRWWVGGAGKVMITTGLLLLGFVAYQLWGTGIETARAQRALESDFEELLAIAPEVDSETSATAPTGAGSAADAAESGDGSLADAADTADNQDTPDAALDEPSEDGAVPTTGGGLTGEAEEVGEPDPPLLAAGGIPPLPVERQNIPEVQGGDALARLEIPAIGVDNIVVAGVQTSDLKKGPGHFPETPLPGQLGNSAIAGHRTTYGQPFHNVDKLEWGDEIIVTTLTGRYVYLVTDKQIVSPSDYQVVTTVDPTVANLTLTSCHPKWTASERIIISSVIDYGRSDRVGEPVLFYGQPLVAEETDGDPATAADEDGADADAVEGEVFTDASDGVTSSLLDTSTVDDQLVGVTALGSTATDAGIADAFAEGWFSDPAAWWDVALWASVLVLLCVGCYLLARHFRRTWVGVLVGVVPFLVALYFFYQNVNRLLPPNL